jgi:hypothetical protein
MTYALWLADGVGYGNRSDTGFGSQHESFERQFVDDAA